VSNGKQQRRIAVAFHFTHGTVLSLNKNDDYRSSLTVRTTNKERIDTRMLGATTTMTMMTMMTTTTKNKGLGATTMTNKERLTQMYNPSSDFMKNVTMIRNVYVSTTTDGPVEWCEYKPDDS